MNEEEKEIKKAKRKLYYQNNKEKLINHSKKWLAKNKEKIKQRNFIYYRENKIERDLYTKNYRKANPDKIRIHKKRHKKKRFQNSIQVRIKKILRSRIESIMRRIKQKKLFSLSKAIGCNAEELKNYLESKFLPDMSWDNHGLYGWHIDHIKPLCSFDLTDEKQFNEACHYTNLQPLWSKDNLKKGSNILK